MWPAHHVCVHKHTHGRHLLSEWKDLIFRTGTQPKPKPEMID